MQNAPRIDRIRGEAHFLSFLPVRRWVMHEISIQKDNMFLWMPVFLAIGIGLYFLLPFELPLALCVLVEIIAIFIVLSVKSSENRAFVLAAFAFLLISSGVLAGKVRTDIIHTPMLVKKHGPVQVSGVIESIETMEEGGGSRIILASVSVEDLEEADTPRKIRLRLRQDTGIHIGQHISALALLNPPSPPHAPNGFDFRRYLYFQGIGAVGFIYNAPEIIDGSNQYSLSAINDIRHKIAQRIIHVLPHREASVAIALMVGQKNAISDDDRQAIRDAGLAHMLAISGLHVGLVASVLFYAIRLILAAIPSFALRYPIKNIAAIAALLGTIAYMLLAGATVPTQRATLMTAIVFLAVILNRNPFSLRLVAVSAFVILLHSPESLMSASFHMSYAAVASLIYFYECTREYWVAAYRKQGWYQGLALYFTGVCVTTIIASIATAPFSLYHFGQVSFIGSVANLVAVPLLAFIIMPFALIGFIAMAIGLEYWPLQVMSIGITQMLEISYWASSLPAAIVRSGAWPFAAFLLMVCSCLFMILWKGWGKICGLPFLVLSIFWIQAQKQPSVLISASHKLFAVQSDGDLYTSSRRSERFVLRQWERYFGLAEQSAQLLPYKGERKYHDHPFINCGEEGCRFTIHGKNVSIIRNNYILEQECHWADVVISPNKIGKKQCADTVAIGKFDTWEEGAHAIFLSDEQITVKTVAQISSNRPWSAYSNRPTQKH